MNVSNNSTAQTSSLRPSVPGPAIVLCLSGGGFRATFFHLGVIKLLRDYGLLENVTDVFSVSGGSILAAHLALNWDDYSNPKPNHETDFYYAASELVLGLGRCDLRGRILRRWLLLGWLFPQFTLTRQLESSYSTFLQKAELKELRSARPKFHFLTTSLTTGKLCSFNEEGFNDGEKLHPASHLPLALAVTASSAFPPFFPPVEITRQRLKVSAEQFPLASIELTDGGVFDNLGVYEIRKEASAQVSGKADRRVIISDASARFDWQPEGRYRNFFSLAARTVDVLSNRAASLEQEHWRRVLGGVTMISIHDRVNTQGPTNQFTQATYIPQDDAVQILVGQIRTDLDEFSLEEICALIRHGFEVAQRRIADLIPVNELPAQGQVCDPCVRSVIRGWVAREDIRLIPTLRAASSCVETSQKARSIIEKGNAELNDLLSLPSEHKPRKPSAVDGGLSELRALLEKSHVRRIRLWNSDDWASWVLLLEMALLLGIASWLINRLLSS